MDKQKVAAQILAGLPLGIAPIGSPEPKYEQRQGLYETLIRREVQVERLESQFTGQDVVAFPNVNRILINEHGAFIPKGLFGEESDLTYRRERSLEGFLEITIFPRTPTSPHREGRTTSRIRTEHDNRVAILRAVVERMHQNPLPHGAPHLTRDEMHERY